MIVDKKYLKSNPNHVFVFGDNLVRRGTGGAAALRYEPNTYGFITKKYPNNKLESFYNTNEYIPIFEIEFKKLIKIIKDNPTKTFLISKLGSGLANRFGIFEKVIEPNIRKLIRYPNVKLLF